MQDYIINITIIPLVNLPITCVYSANNVTIIVLFKTVHALLHWQLVQITKYCRMY